MVNHPGSVISETHIPTLFGEAYVKAENIQNAINGLKFCGIEPSNS